ncbi:sulfatase family protein [Reichenbachiella versicolor]|uniref:sulfatase family protein n=1 Tax=Reichenbachiella versicolor TaxID=1821036 RepID=UPI000D6DF775|nr:arylsulfatase [Reichenbachiella versicolor]
MKKITISLLFTLVLGYTHLLVAKDKLPNIIVVLADDIGTGDISAYRRLHFDKVILETPNIDKLAEEGVMFTNAHSPAALCATSRYSIMTGNYNYRSPFPWGVWSGYAKSAFTPDQLTLGRVMQQAGYHTGFIGKWHLGTDFAQKNNPNEVYVLRRGKKPNTEVDISKIKGGGPSQNGFDYNFTLPSGIQNEPYAAYENDVFFPLKEDSKVRFIDKEFMEKKGAVLDKKEGLGDSNWDPHVIGPLLASKAVEFIGKNSNQKKPFLMYYCAQAVHTPHTPPTELNGIKIAGTTPSAHMDMIKELDVQISMMVAELKKQGIYENTVFIFTSDNGGLHTDGDTWNSHHEPSSIFRGFKNSPYEGGHRVPMIVSWPKSIKGNWSTEAPAIGTDILATIADIGNSEIKEGQALDSYSLLPVLKKEKQTTRKTYIIQGGSAWEGMITEDGWKLILQFDKKDKTNKTRIPVALFNLNDNLREKDSGNYIDDPKYKDKLDYLVRQYNELRDGGKPTGSAHLK